MLDENKEVARVSDMSIEVEVLRAGETVILSTGGTLYLNDLVKANNCTAYLEKLDGEGVMVLAHQELLLDESFQGDIPPKSTEELITDAEDEESSIEQEKISIECLISDAEADEAIMAVEDSYADVEKQDISASESSQWLEARGQLQGSSTGVENFIEEHKSQATYLTELAGAITIEEDGSWLYVINQSAFSMSNENYFIDRVVVNSTDGLKHELEFHIEMKERLAYIKEVKYQGLNNEEVFKQDTIEPSLDTKNETEIQEAFEDSLEKEDLVEPREEIAIPEVKEEPIDSEAMLQKVQERMQLKEKELKEKALVQAEALAQEEKAKREEEEREQKAQDEARALEEAELAKALADEKEMLAQVQIRMQQKEKEREEKARQEAEEKAEAEAKEQKEKAARDAMGGDEMLLKVQALMNAPKQLDLAEVEMVGGNEPTPVKEEEISPVEDTQEEVVEVLEEVEPNEACLQGKIKAEEADGTEVYKSNNYLEGFSLESNGRYYFEPHDISYDYLSENEEEVSTVEVSLVQTNGKKLIGSLDLQVKRINGDLTLSATQGNFAQEEDHSQDFEEMSVEELAGTGEEFSHHSHSEEGTDTHLEGHLAVVFDSLKDGATLHSDGTLGITILLPVGAQAGEAIIVNGSEFVITDPEAEAGKLLYAVYPEDEVEVSYRDCDNNISDSIRAQANHQSVEMLDFILAPEIMGEVGSQSVHAGIGVPPHEGGSWGIINTSNEIVQYMQSEFASLKIDHETGELEYKYHENTGMQKYGKSADTKVCEKFILSLDTHVHADLEVNIHIQVQSIHGYSGQEIDSTTIEEMKLLKHDPSKPEEVAPKDNNMLGMLEAGLVSNKAKISKIMLEIYEAKSAGKDTSEAKAKLQSLTDKKTHLEDKLKSLK